MSSPTPKKARTSAYAWAEPGPNDIGCDNPDRKYKVTAQDRILTFGPGDRFQCACCGVDEYFNIYQHQLNCRLSKYFAFLQMKNRQAYLFVLQRHVDNPTVWKHPGTYRNIKPQLSRQLIARVPVEKLEKQGPRWNVLMQFRTGAVNQHGSNATSGLFYEAVADIYHENYMTRPQDIWMCNFQDYQHGREVELCKKYELNHNETRSELFFYVWEQRDMERNRLACVDATAAFGGFGGPFSCDPGPTDYYQARLMLCMPRARTILINWAATQIFLIWRKLMCASGL